MRILTSKEKGKRGCDYCLDHATIKGRRACSICVYDKCPYHVLDKYDTYEDYIYHLEDGEVYNLSFDIFKYDNSEVYL